MGNRVSQSLSESSQTLASRQSDRWRGCPNLGFKEARGRRGSESSFDSSPGPSESELQVPSLPPRCPRRWSTAAATVSEEATTEEESEELAHPRPRIQPIVRDGRQVTKDFYWVLPERRAERQQYHNLPPRRRSCRSESERPDASPPDGQPMQLLVASVRRRVLGVTDDECFVALSLHGWDTERAARYLMVEQLFRLGLPDRACCAAELAACGWDLQAAGASVIDKYKRSIADL